MSIGNLISATENKSVMQTIWQYASSGYAILIYAIILLVLVAVLVVSLMLTDNRRP